MTRIFTSNPFAIGLTLAAMIAMGSRFSKCHFNPAVSFMMFLNKKIDLNILDKIFRLFCISVK